NLDPNLRVYVEYSDETWSAAWKEYSQVLQAARSNPLVTAPGVPAKIQQQSAYKLVSIAQTFDQVWGADSARVLPIVAGFNHIPALAGIQLQFIQSNYGPPSQIVSGVAIAPYIDIPPGVDVAGMTLKQLFAGLNQNLNTTYVSDLKANVAL